jgi:hypothetical protein
MTRSEAIAGINARLAALDDDEVRVVAELVLSVGGQSVLPRALSEHEHDLIAQSRADFRNDETLSPSEPDDFLDARAAQRAAARKT